MTTTISRRGELAMLHPLVRPQFERLNIMLKAAYKTKIKVFFHPFETYRSPERQDWLWKQGRSEPGKIVTQARAWQSPHQFGLACDFVPRRPADPERPNGPWVWDWDLAKDEDWSFLASCAAQCGLSVPVVWDRPHVEARDVWSDFRTIIQHRTGPTEVIEFPGLEK